MALEFSGKDIMEEELLFLDEILPKMEERRQQIRSMLAQLAAQNEAAMKASRRRPSWDELMKGYERDGISYP